MIYEFSRLFSFTERQWKIGTLFGVLLLVELIFMWKIKREMKYDWLQQ